MIHSRTHNMHRRGRPIIAIRFKDEVVRSKTTFTVGDSLGILDGPMGSNGFSIPNGLPAPVEDPNHRVFNVSKLPFDNPIKYKQTPAETRSYVEAQYHGGITKRDIAEVIFHDLNVVVARSDLLRLLLDHKIPYHFAPTQHSSLEGYVRTENVRGDKVVLDTAIHSFSVFRLLQR
ncbi:hypothetical protein KSC_019910 [Ktedonobacter sp. SOSP1-52]|uniref:hypothetical protein n=1 Tax=Ktedonobacter sp. SOSP1-52 TaxID=2778366 RepID=UPI00191508A0|nr:hypothetical protein [Ktedonobacter sp. SOSP1-52]GHO63099.1 hypothetical protein KSC_019910 [Ktedonobacter sp. SOSP1-52]